MTKVDYLNAASDLRRIAGWMARGQKEVSLVLRHFVGKIKPQDAVKDKSLRLLFAEQTLLSSIRLQNKFS